MQRGTPKTLTEAIRNGLEDLDHVPNIDDAQIIEAHIKDFLSQKFQLFMLPPEPSHTDKIAAMTAEMLWAKIIGAVK
jgi:hypothetical protein